PSSFGREIVSFVGWGAQPHNVHRALGRPRGTGATLPATGGINLPYSAEISRANPTALIFLLDQSSSMLEPFGGDQGKSKAQGVADALNRLLQNLVLKCAKADGVRDFFHVGMLSYGGPVASAFGGALAGTTLVR